MRTDGLVVVADYIANLRLYNVAPNTICLRNQLACLKKCVGHLFYVSPISPEDVSLIAEEVVGRFTEDACNPDGLTLILNEKPA